MKKLLLMCVLFALSCGPVSGVTIGTTVGDGANGWTAGVTIGITIAKAALPVAKAQLDASPLVPAADKPAMDTGFNIAIASLPLAETALATYVQYPTVANQCRVHYLIEQAITGTLQSLQIALAAGAAIAPTTVQAVEGLATIDDLFFPGCADDAPDAGPALRHAEHASAQARLRAVLGGARAP